MLVISPIETEDRSELCPPPDKNRSAQEAEEGKLSGGLRL